MKILHIHSDWKFINYSTAAFRSSKIENTVIYLGKLKEHDEAIINMPFSKANAKIIASMAKDYDVVILYSLRLEHSIICNLLDKNVIVIWRFFGAELYSYLYRDMISKENLKYYRPANLHRLLSIIKNTVLYAASADKLFWNAVKRTNYFLGLSSKEYLYLKERYPFLPPFIQLPYRKIDINTKIEQSDRKLIVLGHSRDIYGNHLEVLQGLQENPETDKFQYVMFFSYSEYSEVYSRAVLDLAKNIPSVKVISCFLGGSEYDNIMHRTAAMVINSYRQMAMGNILYSLCNGIKVYMSEKNIMYEWLLEEGFVISSINDFFKDIKLHNINLSENQAQLNRRAYANLADRYSVEKFNEKLISLSKRKAQN